MKIFFQSRSKILGVVNVDLNGMAQMSEIVFPFTYLQRLKQKFSLNPSIDCYHSDPGAQAAFYDGHKITVLILSKVLSTFTV